MADLKAIVGKVASGERLSRDEAREAFDIIMSGEATPAQIAAFLTGLRLRGETVDEIAGAVATMRAKMTPVAAPADAIDVVGTGGDASGSYNISTATAFVVAGAGVPVAKHGNRALSSKSGAADALSALGVKIDLSPDMIAACITEVGIGFMFAPAHHSAMKHVGPVRGELGFRTVFNLIGPLSNPASVKRYLLGVFSPDWVEPLAHVLSSLGAEKAWVVHGAGGLDELSPSGESKVAALDQGKVTVFTVSPEAAGLPVYPKEAIRGGDAAHNAEALRGVLAGAPGAYRDTVLLNAAAALVVAGRAASLEEGARLAAASIDEGRARDRLERLIKVSNG
jgi:anthranilate phosphoribosyltransferase